MIDSCTSLSCTSYGSLYCERCSHGRVLGMGIDNSGKAWRWEFNPMFGPLFLAKDWDTPLKRQYYSERHRVWTLFNRWMTRRDYNYMWT